MCFTTLYDQLEVQSELTQQSASWAKAALDWLKRADAMRAAMAG